MLELLRFFLLGIFGYGEKDAIEKVNELRQKGFELLLKEAIVEYYKFISKDRLLIATQEPGKLQVVIKPEAIPFAPSYWDLPENKDEVMSNIGLLLQAIVLADNRDRKQIESLLKLHDILDTHWESQYMYFNPLAILGAIVSKIKEFLIDRKAENPFMISAIEAVEEDLLTLVKRSSLSIKTPGKSDHVSPVNIEFKFHETSIRKLNEARKYKK